MTISHSKANKVVKIDVNNIFLWRAGMEQFKYDDQSDYKSNFQVWFSMNTKEKRDNKEEPYNEEVAQRIFNEQYGNKAFKRAVLKPFAWRVEEE